MYLSSIKLARTLVCLNCGKGTFRFTETFLRRNLLQLPKTWTSSKWSPKKQYATRWWNVISVWSHSFRIKTGYNEICEHWWKNVVRKILPKMFLRYYFVWVCSRWVKIWGFRPDLEKRISWIRIVSFVSHKYIRALAKLLLPISSILHRLLEHENF